MAKHLTTEQKIHYTLRFAVAMCFIGHGVFGIITKPIWCNYFAVFGIGKSTAYSIMPWLGSFDILCGILMLVYPVRAIPLWLVFWALITASLRPMSGEPIAELMERAGNFGAPLALLLLSNGFSKPFNNIFAPINPNNHVSDKTLRRVVFCLQLIVFLLLAGHGLLNVIEKKSLVLQYTALGFSSPQNAAVTIGILEIIAGFAVLIRPLRTLLLVLIVWKIVSEFFYPHYEMVEWIERGGSYGSLIALLLATTSNSYREWMKKISVNNGFGESIAV
jgi:hypothetical protein